MTNAEDEVLVDLDCSFSEGRLLYKEREREEQVITENRVDGIWWICLVRSSDENSLDFTSNCINTGLNYKLQ